MLSKRELLEDLIDEKVNIDDSIEGSLDISITGASHLDYYTIIEVGEDIFVAENHLYNKTEHYSIAHVMKVDLTRR